MILATVCSKRVKRGTLIVLFDYLCITAHKSAIHVCIFGIVHSLSRFGLSITTVSKESAPFMGEVDWAVPRAFVVKILYNLVTWVLRYFTSRADFPFNRLLFRTYNNVMFFIF